MIVFIVLDPRGHYSHRIANAVKKRGKKTVMFTWRHFDYSIISRLDPCNDVIFFRTGASEAVLVARAFEDSGFTVINDSRYIQLSGHKYLANVHARANSIAIPTLNVVLEKTNFKLLALYLEQNGPLVAKPVISRDEGRYVFLIKTKADFANVVTIPGSTILLQSEVKFKRLVRTVVTSNGMLVDATTYDVPRDTWKATVCENPLASHYFPVPSQLITVAETTTRVFGGDVAYIDYFETNDGYVLSEINHSCGLIEHEAISGYPIADELGAFIAGF